MTDNHKDNSAQLPEEDQDNSVTAKTGKMPIIIIAILILVCLVVLSKTNIFTTEPPINATGKIISPLNKDTIGSEFVVEGKTKNVNNGQYVWLAFDNPEYRTSFPRAIVPGNEEFKVTIIEKYLDDHLRLSLYVLNEAEHKEWLGWENKKEAKGLKMPTGRKHLDHANLVLK